MSVFTNPSSAAPEQAEAYIQAVLELLGSRDPVPILDATPDALRAAVAAMTGPALATPEREGKWSVGQVLRHLADSEIVWAFRLRMVLSQDRPPLTGYDQDAWADRLDYADADPGESLAEFTVLRRGNLRVLGRATESDLDRVGLHAERGEETVRHMVRLYAGHDLLHLRQIERIRSAVGPTPERAP